MKILWPCAIGVKTYGAVYTLNGTVVEKHHPIGLVAMNAVTALGESGRTMFISITITKDIIWLIHTS